MMLSDPYHDRNFEVKRLLVNNRSFVNALYDSKIVAKESSSKNVNKKLHIFGILQINHMFSTD